MSSRALRGRYAEDSPDEEMLTDDSDELFPSRGRRGLRENRRHMSHQYLHSRHPRHRASRSNAGQVNGVETIEPQEGVRRSTRTRKQKYDSCSNSWIDGMNRHQPLRGYPSLVKQETVDHEETDEKDKHCLVYVSDAKDEDKERSEEEEEEEEEEEGGGGGQGTQEGRTGMKRARTIAELDTTGGNLVNGEEMDMYSRVKRLRRPAKRFMFDEDSQVAPGNNHHIEDNQTETQSSQTSTDSEGGKIRNRKYSLRKTKPTVDRFQASIDPPRASRVLRSMLRRRSKRRGRSSSTSSSDEERFDRRVKSSHNKSMSRCLPTPMNLDPTARSDSKGKSSTNKLADVDPMCLDRSIMFSHVGGLEDHIRCLKEMVVFPTLYREVFDRFHIQPAKGVLFHGLPGTGKTLLARALANECSQGERKVAFFMRKGADCLTKWVGESERQLRLLFDQAYQMRPSIIFFDEIDGLAPVRSSKQDQIHASIVSTLLALMDGLDSRGEVIVIGATNRIDAIDPALRRPGRFDRELYFPLPARQERQEILRIHVSKWEDPPSPHLLTTLAEQAVGYCGSDLRALCSEAVLQGLKRRYPQIYASSQKLLLDANSVLVENEDFIRAKATIVPAAHRCSPSSGRKLPHLIEPLLSHSLAKAVEILSDTFPHGVQRSVASSALLKMCRSVHRPHLLILGSGSGQGQSPLGSALLHYMEHVAVHTLDLSALYSSSSLSAEEACIALFNEARRNLPSIVYVPAIGKLWNLVSDTLHAVFMSKLNEVEPSSPVLLLATCETEYQDLPEEVQRIFSVYRGETLTLGPPAKEHRQAFFSPLLLDECLAPPPTCQQATEVEELPLAPPPTPPKLTEEQLKVCYEEEEATLRELRIFLRDCCSKLARNRQFFMFTKPVDIEEVPDYLNIIKQPMDLETMMTKIDLHRYACAQEFLSDIDLIVRNALEYNPDRTGEDKLIRHRACCLRDTAYALIKAEMDTDYEDKCKRISLSRQKRSDSPSRFVPEFIRTKPVTAPPIPIEIPPVAKTVPQLSQSLPSTSCVKPSAVKVITNGILKPRPWSHGVRKQKKRSSWSRGFLKKVVPKRVVRPIVVSHDEVIPTSHAPTMLAKDSDEEPLANGVSKETPDVSEEASKSPVLLNGSDSERQLNPLLVQPNILTWFDDSDRQVSTPQISVDSVVEVVTTEIEERPSSLEQENVEGMEEEEQVVIVDTSALKGVLKRAVKITDGCDVDSLLDLHAQLNKQVFRFNQLWNRTQLIQTLTAELDRFVRVKSAQQKTNTANSSV